MSYSDNLKSKLAACGLGEISGEWNNFIDDMTTGCNEDRSVAFISRLHSLHSVLVGIAVEHFVSDAEGAELVAIFMRHGSGPIMDAKIALLQKRNAESMRPDQQPQEQGFVDVKEKKRGQRLRDFDGLICEAKKRNPEMAGNEDQLEAIKHEFVEGRCSYKDVEREIAKIVAAHNPTKHGPD